MGGLYVLVGVLALLTIAVGGWRLRHRAPVAVTFVASIGGMLFVWPFVDSRLLLPAIPLLIALAIEGLRSLDNRSVMIAGLAWSAVFVACGVVVLGVSLRLTFAGDRVPELHYEDLESTYRVAWGAAPTGLKGVEPRSLWALRRYEPRAVGEPGPGPRPSTTYGQ
jgi:hypothetical protein